MEIIYDISVRQGIYDTNQDFLLNIWWNATGHPDVIFHQGTAVHDVKYINSTMESKYYRQFFQKMSRYVEKHRSVYFWSNSPMVREHKVPEQYKSITKNDKLQVLNRVALGELIPLSGKYKKSRLNFGLDLHRLSENLSAEAYNDAVHHKVGWYRNVGGKLLSMYCVWLSL